MEPLRWAKSDEIVATITQENSIVRLQCKAVGFPSPSYHWYKGDELVEGASSHTIDVVRCKCSSAFTFYCVVTNEVEDGHIYSEFYRKPGKQYSSRLVSRSISMSPFVGEEQRCESCRNVELENLREIMASMSTSALERPPDPPSGFKLLGQFFDCLVTALHYVSQCAHAYCSCTLEKYWLGKWQVFFSL
ncbi:unnamed protein product [Heligmosomoides polygyrus]|uniref:Ig-like domain-containing protein n=1 Tax=Heligmosomoides polygyrus TaxID=6339 RepID=A0A183GKI9_HELPZ|nr:unnamed protein product [Heligmosomoides polygyrus]